MATREPNLWTRSTSMFFLQSPPGKFFISVGPSDLYIKKIENAGH